VIQTTEPLLPLFVISGFFILGLPLFALHVRKHGLPKDDRIEKRKVGPFLGRWLMYYLLWIISPVEKLLIRLGVSPNTLTFSSLLLSAGAGVALALGRFGLGGWLYLFTGIFDIFDGRVARATGRVTKGGAFYDSVVDRWAEALIFCGLGWYYRASWVLVLVMIALVASFMVSYARARGEGLGATGGDAGAMQRPERILYLGVGVALSPIVASFDGSSEHPLHLLAVIALGLVTATSFWTALMRSWVIFKQLANKPLTLDDAPSGAGAEPLKTTPTPPPPSNGDHDSDEKRADSSSVENSLLV
jgi:phosphatidylglycerophosphate synthase